MTARNVVADASPLIALACAGGLSVLPELYVSVTVPPAVWREVVEQPGRPGADAVREATWIRRAELRDVGVARDLIARGFGPGESEVLALALEVAAESALIDDRRARREAARLGVRTRGVLGTLALAARAGIVDRNALPSLFDRLAANGFRFTPKERGAALAMAEPV